MTDQTTAAPSGQSAHREAAVEVEDLLSHLDSTDPDTLEVAFGRGRRYRLHTRTLRLARSALRQSQDRIDAARNGLVAQGPTDVDVRQVRNLSRLVSDLTDAQWPTTLDLAIMNIKPNALAAVLRAGLASVVGDATETSVDATPAPEPASAEVPSPSAGEGHLPMLSELGDYLDTWRHGLDGRRYTYVALLPSDGPGGYVTGSDVPSPAYISVAGLVMLLRAATEPADTAPSAEVPSPSAEEADVDGFSSRLREGLHGVAQLFGVEQPTPEYSSENPVREAVYGVLSNGEGAPVADLVRDLTIAALDAAAIEVRTSIVVPAVSPIVMLDAPVPADRVLPLVERVRESAADAAADELRILARSDAVR